MTRPLLIIAHATDVGAASVAACLAQEVGAQAVRVVRPETLGLARWPHTVNSLGRATTRVALPRAEVIESGDVGAVLNRILYLPLPRFRQSSPKDRDYAGAEIQALVASWLAALGGRVVHVVRDHPWVTPPLPLQHWANAAAACKLPVARRVISNLPCAQAASALRSRACRANGGHGNPADGGETPAGTVLVAGGNVAGALVARFGSRCLDAAHVLGFPLLEFRFVTKGNETVLVHVDPLPPRLEPWGAALASRLLISLAGSSAK